MQQASVTVGASEPKSAFHIGGDVEALFEPPYDYANGSRSLEISDRPEVRIDPTQIVGAANIQNGSSSSIANVSHAQVYSVEAAGNWGPGASLFPRRVLLVQRRPPLVRPTGHDFYGTDPALQRRLRRSKLGRDR